MQILPVLDLLNGAVVRGVAGKRETYRPIVSQLTHDSSPQGVAQAFRDQFGLDEFYVADLDAILHDQPQWETYRQLAQVGFRLRVDAGVSEASRARQLLEAGAVEVIVGLESCCSPEQLEKLCESCGKQRLTFSLDLKGGIPFGNTSGWRTNDPEQIARQALETGVEGIIVLDLAQVGSGAGCSTIDLCKTLRPLTRQLITGGGVRHLDDLRRLQDLGIDGVLVASALHDGTLTPADLLPFRTS